MRASRFVAAAFVALATLALAQAAAAQSVTYTIFSTGTDDAYSGSFDGTVGLPFKVDATGYFKHNDVDGISREDARVVASRPLYRGVFAAYEFRANDGDAPNRFGFGYRAPCGVNAVYFPYGVDNDTDTVDEDGQTVQVNGARTFGEWRVKGILDVTKRDDVTRYWATVQASLEVAPRTAFVGEYRARPSGFSDVQRSVWFGLAFTPVQ